MNDLGGPEVAGLLAEDAAVDLEAVNRGGLQLLRAALPVLAYPTLL